MSFGCSLPLLSVSERGFSVTNRIETALRTSVRPSTLLELMTITGNGPALEDFDHGPGTGLWFNASKSFTHDRGHSVLST